MCPAGCFNGGNCSAPGICTCPSIWTGNDCRQGIVILLYGSNYYLIYSVCYILTYICECADWIIITVHTYVCVLT